MEKYDTAKSARPRPIEVKLRNCFDKRCVMANVEFLKGTSVFVKPKLCWKDCQFEESLLGIRYITLYSRALIKSYFASKISLSFTMLSELITMHSYQTLCKV